jgi:hypothetical protein
LHDRIGCILHISEQQTFFEGGGGGSKKVKYQVKDFNRRWKFVCIVLFINLLFFYSVAFPQTQTYFHCHLCC